MCGRAVELFHRPQYVKGDPLECVLPYAEVADREVAGLVASCLALGRAPAIVRAVEGVLARLRDVGEGSPHRALTVVGPSAVERCCRGFVYRFFDEAQLSALLLAIRRVLARYGTLERCFARGLVSPDARRFPPAVAGLQTLSAQLTTSPALSRSILVARPAGGSACKRLLLFLRWLVRSDCIDPGGWTAVGPGDLLVPLDTHMLRVCRALGITRRHSATLGAAIEVTEAFRAIDPQDPVRYDFALTRPGISLGADSRSIVSILSRRHAVGDRLQ